VGLKNSDYNNKFSKQTIFIRYDSAYEVYTNNLSYTQIDFVGKLGYSLFNSDYIQGNPSKDYTLLAFHPYTLATEAGTYELPNQSYDNYRTRAHRSAEARIELANPTTLINQADPNGILLGSWHRVTAGWNLHWEKNGPEPPESKDQLWILLHDEAFVKQKNSSIDSPFFEFKQDRWPRDIASVLNGDMPGANARRFAFARANDVGKGVMVPYDSSMVLSLGESQARRMAVYEPAGTVPELGTGVSAGFYTPFWRLNSCIDNFRFYMGPSDPQHFLYRSGNISKDFFSIRSALYKGDSLAMPKNNFLGAMRYKVFNGRYVDPGAYPDLAHPVGTSNEPSWYISPGFSESFKLLSCGARVYYPKTLTSTLNCPYVKLNAYKISESTEDILPERVSKNEQQFFFSSSEGWMDQSFKLSFQYMAYKPILDGDLETPVFDSSGQLENAYDILEYKGYIDRSTGAARGHHFVNIPWIKEVNFRVIPSKGEQILSWDEK
jgi:hypothetical protein